MPRAEPPQHILAEKRAIHAKADRPAVWQQRRQLRPQIPQEGQPRFPVVDVPRPIFHAQHVSSLGQVRHDRVVTRHLPVMRVEPAEGPLDLQPGRDHHAVDIDRPRAHAQRRQHARDHRRVDRLQPCDGRHREPLQPPTHRARRRHHLDLAEALEQRVILDEGEMPQPPAAHEQQPHQHPHHRHRPEVTPGGHPGHGVADRRIEAGRAQVAAEQLEPGIRGQRDVGELELHISIDSGSQIGSASSHVRWPFVVEVEGWVTPPFNHNARPFSISKCHEA